MKYEEIKDLVSDKVKENAEIIDGYLLSILKLHPNRDIQDIELISTTRFEDGMLTYIHGIRLKDD